MRAQQRFLDQVLGQGPVAGEEEGVADELPELGSGALVERRVRVSRSVPRLVKGADLPICLRRIFGNVAGRGGTWRHKTRLRGARTHSRRREALQWQTPRVPDLDPETRLRRVRLGEAVRRLRQERGLTQEELADRAGVDRKSINRLENAAYSPAVDRIYLLAAALGVQVAMFFPDD